MDPMEIMMEMTAFRRRRLKIKQERTFYSSLLGHNISLIARLDTIRVPFDSSKATPRVTYFKTFRVIENNRGAGQSLHISI